MDLVLITYYSVAIVVVSTFGGLIPDWIKLTHRRTELVVSFVAGAILGVGLLHMLPHSMISEQNPAGLEPAAAFRWVLGGFLAMFFIERFFCFHHHDVPDSEGEEESHHTCHDHDHPHSDHTQEFTWSGAAIGLTLHSLLAGVALAASVSHAPYDARAAGFGVFLAIVLHKPFDAMTIAMLMKRGGWSPMARCIVNGLFALVVPIGISLFYIGVSPHDPASSVSNIHAAIAFSAGVFLCVAMSDLLPELHFHHHDRIKLSLALILGLTLADLACRLESHSHQKNSSENVETRSLVAPTIEIPGSE